MWAAADQALEELAAELEQAVIDERYEDAAMVRDNIRDLNTSLAFGDWSKIVYSVVTERYTMLRSNKTGIKK